MKAKTFLVSALLCAFAVSTGAYAQENTEILKNSVQFQVSDNFSIKNFDGYTFSYKYRFGPSSAFRVGAGVSGYSNGDEKKSGYNDIWESIDQDDCIGYNIRIAMQYLKTVGSINNVEFYVGIGPQFSYAQETVSYKDTYDPYGYIPERKTRTTKCGADVLGGVECPVSKSISIFGEYGLEFSYTWYKYTYTSPNKSRTYKSEQTQDTFSAALGNARLGVSVNF